MLTTDITIHTYRGMSIRPYASSIARLLVDISREYPFFCDTHLENELEFIQKYIACEESIAVIIFDGSAIVGASIGIPLEKEDDLYIRPFRNAHINFSRFFHFGESLLLKPYRGRGIGHHFFDLREKHVKELKRFSHTCFCCVDRPEDDPERPDDFRSLTDFWRRRGYVHHGDIRAYVPWKEIEKETVQEYPCSFWIKELC